MNIDNKKIDDVILAVLYLTYDESTGRAWKGLDWDALDRLHQKGLISDPKNKNKSVALTESGASQAKKQFEKLFSK
jgi:DNA-binding PadR family transcriptional regulator